MALEVGAADEHAADGPSPPSSSAAQQSIGRDSPGHLRWVLPLLVVLFAGVLRFIWLPHPERVYFDETYYAKDAAQLLVYGVEAEVRVPSDPAQGVDPTFVVHPPVGKWLIAGGIAAFGDNSLGWRVASAGTGTLLVAVTYFLGLRLFRRRGIAALAALLIAIDGLALTMSRIAMLDIFLALFVAVGVWCLLIDRDQRWTWTRDWQADRDASTTGAFRRRLPRLPRPYLWMAGIAFGLALASKWSALLAIAGAGLWLLASELAWRRAVTGRWWRQSWRLIAVGIGSLVLVPLAIYLGSYVSWFANYEHTRPGVADCAKAPCSFTAGGMARGWWSEQQDIFRFHRDLEVTHTYRAPAILWPIMRRPVVYYYESCRTDRAQSQEPCSVPQGRVEEILGLGNPVIWWAALPVYLLLAYAAVRRRDRIAATLLVFLLAQYLPWLGPSRPLFLFYALPLVPFMVLGLAWAAAQALRRRWLRWAPLLATGAAVGAFLWWSPIYYGVQISEQAWRLRMLLPTWI